MKITKTQDQLGRAYIQLGFNKRCAWDNCRFRLIRKLMESQLEVNQWTENMLDDHSAIVITLLITAKTSLFLLKHQELIQRINTAGLLELYQLGDSWDLIASPDIWSPAI